MVQITSSIELLSQDSKKQIVVVIYMVFSVICNNYNEILDVVIPKSEPIINKAVISCSNLLENPELFLIEGKIEGKIEGIDRQISVIVANFRKKSFNAIVEFPLGTDDEFSYKFSTDYYEKGSVVYVVLGSCKNYEKKRIKQPNSNIVELKLLEGTTD